MLWVFWETDNRPDEERHADESGEGLHFACHFVVALGVSGCIRISIVRTGESPEYRTVEFAGRQVQWVRGSGRRKSPVAGLL